MNQHKPTLTIDLDVIANNYKLLLTLCSAKCAVGAAVKADCYGLGMKQIVPILMQLGCQTFFVANHDEGLTLRQIIRNNPSIADQDLLICVFNGVFADTKETLLDYQIVPVINHIEQLMLWQEYSIKRGKKLPCLIHINTGMHRLGMSEQEMVTLHDILSNTSTLDVIYVLSHLISAEEVSNPLNEQQRQNFIRLAGYLPTTKKSLANSGGMFLGQKYHFDLVRPGAALYGINPQNTSTISTTISNTSTTMISNPISLTAPIIQIQTLMPWDTVGYNATYTNKRNDSCQIATIPIGYADGYCRYLSNNSMTYIKGYQAPVIGRISMDLTVIDVSDVPQEHLFLGQQVELIGKHITPDALAKYAKTNTYEILTSLGYRFERVYTSCYT